MGISINIGMNWQNLNRCYSFTETFGTTVKTLSSAFGCEVIIHNYGPNFLYVYDSPDYNFSSALTFAVAPSGSMTFRGITSSDQVSAGYLAGTGLVSYRVQYFSSNPLNTY